MKKLAVLSFALSLVVLANAMVMAEETTITFGRFGNITLYQPTPHPANVILFVSGDGGWNKGVVDMARDLAAMDTLVAGIDIVHYLRQLATAGDACGYPAADFENLSHFLQKRLRFPQYILPALVGYSSGATLVYAVLAQAPPGTFIGAISLGFCPDLPLDKPLCKGSGLTMTAGARGRGIVFLPAGHLKDPWIALQGTVDQVCNPPETQAFVQKVANAELILLPKVGHGYSVPKNWMPQFTSAFVKMSQRRRAQDQIVNADLADLPLTEVPATGRISSTLAVLITGDGGWAGLDQDIAARLAQSGIAVVGLNALKYFWTPRSPDRLGADLGRILGHYMGKWQKTRALLIGYSMGADVLPFAVNRLSPDRRAQVTAVGLLAPGYRTAFAFHLSNWIGGDTGDTLPVQPEVERISVLPVICAYGKSDKESLCPALDPKRITVMALSGGHHFGGDYDTIIEALVSRAEK